MEFGTVTAAVNAVTAVYAPQLGSTVIPRTLDVWSDLTADRHVADGVAPGRGEAVRYDVTRDYTLDRNDPIVVVELVSASGLAPADPACRQGERVRVLPRGSGRLAALNPETILRILSRSPGLVRA